MSSQRYQRVNTHDDSDTTTPAVPSSPPPSFHSRSTSPSSRRLLPNESRNNEADRTLEDAFGGDDDSDSDDEPDDRQRLMRAGTNSRTPSYNSNHNAGETAPSSSQLQSQSQLQTQSQSGTEGRQDGSNGSGGGGGARERSATVLPTFGGGTATSGRVISSANDGVFTNLSAKPERGEKNEDHPPSYEEAAADATPPYWETTIVAPGLSSDEVFVDGLPVGSIFSFVWNAMISMSFQLVGFLLTYLLHTTHAAKNGSRAGLGLTLVQYGFYMKGSSESKGQEDDGSDQVSPPPDPNSHNFDPNTVAEGASAGATAESSSGLSAISTSEWISYVLMIVGWFILIRAVSDFLRARRHEQLVLQSPDRGLGVPIIAEGETSETVV